MKPLIKTVAVTSVDTAVENHIAKETNQDFFGPVFFICLSIIIIFFMAAYAWCYAKKSKDLSGKKWTGNRRSILPWR